MVGGRCIAPELPERRGYPSPGVSKPSLSIAAFGLHSASHRLLPPFREGLKSFLWGEKSALYLSGLRVAGLELAACFPGGKQAGDRTLSRHIGWIIQAIADQIRGS